jgi:hypothetical protein
MSELNDMTCAELADVAAELALGVLTGRERAAALAHLDTCDACREEVRQLMATGGQLLELLPPAEPPAGFETRVLDRLGLPAPAKGHAELLQASTRERRRHRRARGGSPASAAGAAVTRPGRPRPGAPGPAAAGPGPAAPRTGPTSRLRRALATSAVGLAVIAAGLGCWRIGVDSAPAASSAAAPLTSASLVSASHQEVGDIYYYSGDRRWLYMWVDLGSGNESVTCQVIDSNGKVTTVGSFVLAGGYGGWGSPDPGTSGTLSGARLVSASGSVLATASFAG